MGEVNTCRNEFGKLGCVLRFLAYTFTKGDPKPGDFEMSKVAVWGNEKRIWAGLISRCENPKNHAYKWYGGRGIRVCVRWKESFEAFLADMGPRPSKKHSVDRIDNDKGYSPGNCRWATTAEQHRNRSDNVVVAYKGETKCLKDWANFLGQSYSSVLSRFRRGWSLAEIAGEVRREPTNSTGYHGVTEEKGSKRIKRFKAKARLKSKKVDTSGRSPYTHIGRYHTAEEAAIARDIVVYLDGQHKGLLNFSIGRLAEVSPEVLEAAMSRGDL